MPSCMFCFKILVDKTDIETGRCFRCRYEGYTKDTDDDYPEVRRVIGENSTYIEPPLDSNWDDLKKLRWNAAVVTEDTGLRVLVHPVDLGKYSVQVGNYSAGAVPYSDAWRYISAVSIGAQAYMEMEYGV